MKYLLLSSTLTALLVAGCGGGGGGGQSARCDSITGGQATVTSSCTGCNISNEDFAADGNLSSFANASVSLVGNATATIRATAQEGIVYPAGSNAGVFYTPGSDVCSNCAVTITTYLDGAPQESNSGTNNGTGSGSPAALYTSVSTLLPFDAVEIVTSGTVSPTGDETILEVYEICSDGSF